MRLLLGMLFASLITFGASAQDSPFRKELKRADLTGSLSSGVAINYAAGLEMRCPGGALMLAFLIPSINFLTGQVCTSHE